MDKIDPEKETKEEIRKLINSLPEKERSNLLRGIMPDPLNNLTWINLGLIWKNCKDGLGGIQKLAGGKKLIKLFEELEELGCFKDK